MPERSEIVSTLKSEFEARGVDSSALDDLVLDRFCDDAAELANQTGDEAEQDETVDDAERLGAVVDNLGLEAQIGAIIDGHGLDEGARLVREAGEAWIAANRRRAP